MRGGSRNDLSAFQMGNFLGSLPGGRWPSQRTAQEEEDPEGLALMRRWSEVKEEGVERNQNGKMIITQLDMYHHVFAPLLEAAREPNSGITRAVLTPVVTEYIRSVCRHYMRPEAALNNHLVTLLVESGQYYEFHQFLQYHILTDSTAIAETLLSLAPTYPPAYQLGLDMLYRLNEFEWLLQVLLKNKQVLTALRLVSARSTFFTKAGLQPRDFLDVARHDHQVFFTAFKYFERRNVARTNSFRFPPEDNCQEFEVLFSQLFGADALPARKSRPWRESVVSESDESDDDDDDRAAVESVPA